MLRFLLLSALAARSLAQLNIVATMDNMVDLDKFVDLLDKVGVSPTMGRTVFAPTKAAWEEFQNEDQERWDHYTQDSQFFVHFRELVEWHLVIEDEYKLDEIFNGVRTLMETARGNITIDQEFKKIDNVARGSFSEPDIECSNAILHVIDDVLVPPFMGVNLISHMLDYETSAKFAFTTMANLAIYAELTERIDAFYEKGFTFLVPPNRRFNRAQIDVPSLLTDDMKSYTRDFVLCHMIKEGFHEAGIFAAHNVEDVQEFAVLTELGTTLWITTTEDKLRFQSTDVLLADQAARNGIFHVLDMPLYPPFASDFTEFVAFSTSHDTSDCFRFFRQILLSSEDISVMFNTTLTVFCPSREAFANFNNEDFARLIEPIWVRHATEFVLNHISSPAMTREELVAKAPGEITMLNGATYDLRRSGLRPRIKNGVNEQARSEFGDMVALDGYLHMLDTAVTPTAVSRSIYDQAADNPDFSHLVENIDWVDLTDLIDRDLPLTMLTPPNKAWERITFGALKGADIIKSHIFRGLLFCDVIANETVITDVKEEPDNHHVELRGENNEHVYVDGAYIYQCDVLCRNGISHYVDRVMGMDYPTIAPSVSPYPTATPEPTVYVAPTAAPIEVPTGAAPISFPPQIVPRPTKAPTRQPEPTVDKSAADRQVPIAGMLVLSALLSWTL